MIITDMQLTILLWLSYLIGATWSFIVLVVLDKKGVGK